MLLQVPLLCCCQAALCAASRWSHASLLHPRSPTRRLPVAMACLPADCTATQLCRLSRPLRPHLGCQVGGCLTRARDGGTAGLCAVVLTLHRCHAATCHSLALPRRYPPAAPRVTPVQRQVLQQRRHLAARDFRQLGPQLPAHHASLQQASPLGAACGGATGTGMTWHGQPSGASQGAGAAKGWRTHALLFPAVASPCRSRCQDLGASCSPLPCCTGQEPPLKCLDGGAGPICSRIPVGAAPACLPCPLMRGRRRAAAAASSGVRARPCTPGNQN